MKNKGILSLLMILAVSAGSYYLIPKPDYSLMHASLFNIYSRIAEEGKMAPPDLAITAVKLVKTGDPKDYFNSFKYKTEVTIKNHGSEVKKGEIIIKSPGSPEVSLGENFKMPENGEYTIKNFEVFFDADYNFGEIPIEIELRGGKERYFKNNIYLAEISEMPAKIKVTAEDLLNGDIPEGVDVFVNDTVLAREVEYGEITANDEIISYHKIQNSKSIIDSKGWHKKKDYHGESGYVYLGKTDPQNGDIAVSDIWKFTDKKDLTRAEFAKVFVDEIGVKLDKEGLEYFEDIDATSEYGPYVRTLYNLGLIDGESTFYHPTDPIGRGEALRIVMDYFDVDLFTESKEDYVGGVEEDNEFYPYLEALYSDGKGQFFADPFNPADQATDEFVKTIINLYE